MIDLSSFARWAALLPTLVFCLTFAGCDGGDSEPTSPETVVGARPSLKVLTPAAGAVLDEPEAVLTFRVEDAPASSYSVHVDRGEPVAVEQPIEVDEEVEVPLELWEGVNTIELTVADDEGESDQVTWVLIYSKAPEEEEEEPEEEEEEDAVRPGVTILSPQNGAIVHTSSLELTFEVNGAPALGYALRVGGEETQVATELIEDETVTETIELAEGSNTIEVAVYDAEGEAERSSIAVILERRPAPVVLIDSPQPDALVYGPEIEVAGLIVSERPITASFRVGAGGPMAVALSTTAEGYRFAFAAPLALGSHTIYVSAEDDRGQSGEDSVSLSREQDTAAPVIHATFPRDDQAVKTRRVLVRGRVEDNHGVASVSLVVGSESVQASLDAEGRYHAWLTLEPAENTYEIRAKDLSDNESVSVRSVYFGQRLGAGGAFGGAIRDGQLFSWGRNNLGQTGLDYVSHENRNAFCDRTLPAGSIEVTWCKAITLTHAQAICDLARAADPLAADTCKAEASTRRDAICAAAGAGAPANCATSATVNLINACEAAYGAGTPAAASCKADLMCGGAYDSGALEQDACVLRVTSTPNAYPSPPTPYSATRITKFSTTATPAAEPGTEVGFDELGTEFISLAFNQNAASALDAAGRVWSWGDGAFGVLCLGDTITDADENDRRIPHRVVEFGAAGTRAIALSRGFNHLLILRSDGTVWACGQNNVGQLGDGTFGTSNNRALPVQVQGLPADIIQIAASSQSSYALTSDGKVFAWGRNQYGNLGQGTASSSTEAQPTPLLVPDLTDVTVLANGRDHVLVARADGRVYAWGLNASNQVGPGEGNVLSPVQVANVTDAVAVYANGNQGFYQDSLGRLFGWGQNGNTANLGIPETADQPAPTLPVFGLSELTDVAIGATHGYAMKGETVFAWGWSFHGSLGGGSSTIHAWGYRTPILVQFLP